jgi:hypothetical protein
MKGLKNFDWLPKKSELIQLFTKAGLDGLVTSLRDESATCPDIERVLVELVIHRRVPYLPVLPTPELDADLLYSGTEVPSSERKKLRKFIDSLPGGIVVHRYVCHPGSRDSVPSLIVIVICDTPITQLEAAFTLIPAPRPVDVLDFLNS